MAHVKIPFAIRRDCGDFITLKKDEHMALEDRDIFLAVCERFSDKPMDYIMTQYALARKMNRLIEKDMEAEEEDICECETVEVAEEAAPAKRYTKRSLRVKPQDAITDDSIFCCICGLERQTLSAKHIATHGLTVDEYKKLCGYPEDQKLMSRRQLAKSREIINKAQQARMEKKAVKESFDM